MKHFKEIIEIYNLADSPEDIFDITKKRIKNTYNNKLYQYCSFNPTKDPYDRNESIAGYNRYFQNVLDRVIYGSAASNFNDPFDSTIGISDRSILSDILKTFINLDYIENRVSKALIKEMFKDSRARFTWIDYMEKQEPQLIGDLLLEILKNDDLYFKINPKNTHELFKQKPMNVLEKKRFMKAIFQSENFQDSFINNFIDKKYYNQSNAEKLKSLLNNNRVLIETVLNEPISVNIDGNNNIRDFNVSLEKINMLGKHTDFADIDYDTNNLKKALGDATDIALKGLEEFYLKFNNQFGITCFSKRSDIPLMWSHYSNKHTGFAIEYDFSNLTIEDAQKIAFLLPVHYDKLRRRLDARLIKNYMDNDKQVSTDALMLLFMEIIYVKAKEWKYENEVRNIVKIDDTGNRVIPFNYVKSIILGAKCKNETIKIFKDMCHYENIDLYQYSLHNDEYKLILSEKIEVTSLIKLTDYVKKHKLSNIKTIKNMIDQELIIDAQVKNDEYYISPKIWKIDKRNANIKLEDKFIKKAIMLSIIKRVHLNHKMLGIEKAHFEEYLKLFEEARFIKRVSKMHPGQVESYIVGENAPNEIIKNDKRLLKYLDSKIDVVLSAAASTAAKAIIDKH